MKFLFQMLSLFTLKYCTAQNLVANGSLEDYTVCPQFISEIDHATGWMSFQQSPDYLNSCSSSYYVTVPNNWLGPQYAATGNAYAGIVTMFAAGGVFVNTREYLASQLILPLQVGATYLVSFKANKAINDSFAINLATNHLGARFTSTLYSVNQPLVPDNYSQVDESSVITDTANWVTVSGTFVADSNYLYIVVGNFYQDDQTDTLQLGPEPYGGGQAYYFIDDVSVMQQFGDEVGEMNPVTQPALYPNPTNQSLHVDLKRNNIEKAEIFSPLGKTFLVKLSEMQNDHILIGTGDLPVGIYLLKLHGSDKEWLIPFAIQH